MLPRGHRGPLLFTSQKQLSRTSPNMHRNMLVRDLYRTMTLGSWSVAPSPPGTLPETLCPNICLEAQEDSLIFDILPRNVSGIDFQYVFFDSSIIP